MSYTLRINTTADRAVIDVTGQVNQYIKSKKVKNGLCTAYVTHTTCALTTGEIGEGTDEDFLEVIKKLIPQISFRHSHNPSHAWTHMAASLIGPSLTLAVKEERLVLGTWQSLLLIELDGPRQRKINLTVIPEK